jgi:hypothetical protein
LAGLRSRCPRLPGATRSGSTKTRTAHTQQALIGPTLPIYEAYNPAIAEVNAEHVFSIAEFDVMNNGMAPEQAIDKAFKWAEAIFAKYQIVQG